MKNPNTLGYKLKIAWTSRSTKKVEFFKGGLKIGQAPTWSKAKDKIDKIEGSIE